MAAREIISCVLLITLLIAPAASRGPVFGDEPPDGLPADFTARVDEIFAKWNRRDCPGCAVGIVHRGQVIYRKGFGSADLEYRVSNTPRTVFDVMSFSNSLAVSIAPSASETPDLVRPARISVVPAPRQRFGRYECPKADVDCPDDGYPPAAPTDSRKSGTLAAR
jgi:Beta-lactamase